LEISLLRVDCKEEIDVLSGVAAVMMGVFPSLLSSVVAAGACWALCLIFCCMVAAGSTVLLGCLSPVAREV